jgi:hypothetical protein
MIFAMLLIYVSSMIKTFNKVDIISHIFVWIYLYVFTCLGLEMLYGLILEGNITLFVLCVFGAYLSGCAMRRDHRRPPFFNL